MAYFFGLGFICPLRIKTAIWSSFVFVFCFSKAKSIALRNSSSWLSIAVKTGSVLGENI